jgi:branched-chain amino acid transport system ATP-binding protein
MADFLRLSGVRAGYGETVVLEDVAFSLAERGSLACWAERRRQDHLARHHHGHTSFHAGSIEFNGQPVSRMPAHQRNRIGIGYVPQAREIFPSLSVTENLQVARHSRSGPGRWNAERVFELFPRLADRRSHMGNQLSGGEQQMLATGRALMGNPSLLLMDEPLEGLAPIIVETLLKALERLIREESLTVVLVEQHASLRCKSPRRRWC